MWLGIDIICNFIVFIVVLPILKDYLFEPTGVVNEDWTWLWSALLFYFIFCAFSMAIELGNDYKMVVYIILNTIMRFTLLVSRSGTFPYQFYPKSLEISLYESRFQEFAYPWVYSY